jgi:cyclophilin family peptidyl-prolyl cis-trans isomerase
MDVHPGHFSPRFYFLNTLRVGLAAVFLSTVGCHPAGRVTKTADSPPPPPGPLVAVIDTDRGTIEFELFRTEAPKTSENFRLLAERGYYNGLTFHRVIKGFMLQGGDPNGDGSGGESAWGGTFADEIDPSAPLYRAGYKRGLVAMANAGPNTNGSQFFILHQDYPLRPNYTIFGRVVKGIEVVDALAETPTRPGSDGDLSAPNPPIVIRKVTIRRGTAGPSGP